MTVRLLIYGFLVSIFCQMQGMEPIKKIKSMIPGKRNSQKLSAPPNLLLINGTHLNDINTVNEAIGGGADVNIKDDKYPSLLYAAVEMGHTAIALALIKAKANVNIKGPQEWTILLKALEPKGKLEGRAYQEFVDLIMTLLTAGAKIDVSGPGNRYPLIMAINQGLSQVALKMVKKLVKKQLLLKISPHQRYAVSLLDIRDTQGNTPLLLAIKKGLTEVAHALIKGGASIEVSNKQEWTPLLTAIYHNHKDILMPLLNSKMTLSKPNNNGLTPLLCSLFVRNDALASTLITMGAELEVAGTFLPDTSDLPEEEKSFYSQNLLDEEYRKVDASDHYSQYEEIKQHDAFCEKWTPLLKAVADQNIKLVKALLTGNAQMGTTLKNGRTVLHLASMQENTEILEYLLEQSGAKNILNSTDIDGLTPLHNAVEYGSLKAVGKLLEKKAFVFQATKKQRWTPLHLAVYRNNKEIVLLLVTQGAPKNVQDSQGLTPYALALEQKKVREKELQEKHQKLQRDIEKYLEKYKEESEKKGKEHGNKALLSSTQDQHEYTMACSQIQNIEQELKKLAEEKFEYLAPRGSLEY